MKHLILFLTLFSVSLAHARKPATLENEKKFLRCTKILGQNDKAWYELKDASIDLTYTLEGYFRLRLESTNATNHHLGETSPDQSFFREIKFQIQRFDEHDRMKLLSKSYSLIWGRAKTRAIIKKINDNQAELEFLQKGGSSVYLSLKMTCELE